MQRAEDESLVEDALEHVAPDFVREHSTRAEAH
jgi:hypothetical protein